MTSQWWIARDAAERTGGLAAQLVLDVEQGDLGAACDQPRGRRLTEARSSAADDCLDPIEIHGFPGVDSLQPKSPVHLDHTARDKVVFGDEDRGGRDLGRFAETVERHGGFDPREHLRLHGGQDFG